MFARILGLLAFTAILGVFGGLLVQAGAMPWPAPFVLVAVLLLAGGIALSRRGPRRPRQPLLDDTEPAGIKPPPE